MRIKYKIYKVDTIDVDTEVHSNGYDAPTRIKPTVLRELRRVSWEDEDTFDSLSSAEEYLEKNLIKEYGDTYTIIKEYN